MEAGTCVGVRWAVNCSSWVPTKQEWVCALAQVQHEEVDRIRQFVFQRDSKFALVGRLLIRAGIREWLGGGEPLRLGRSARGKPMLLDRAGQEDSRLGFNVSHQGDYTILATEVGRLVGVDVMQFSRPRGNTIPEFFHTMRRQFTTKEWAQIRKPGITEKHQLNNFYRFWCLKESFIKAEGSGLSFGLQNLEFVCNEHCLWPPTIGCVCSSTQLYVKGQLAEEWTFEETLIDQDHCVSVAVGGSRPPSLLKGQGFTLTSVDQILSKLGENYRDNLNRDQLERHWEQFTQKELIPN